MSIITTAANAFIAPYHQRMPVILDPSSYAAWLDPNERTPEELVHLLKPLPPEWLMAFPVSTVVNNVRIDSPMCLEPTGEVIVYNPALGVASEGQISM